MATPSAFAQGENAEGTSSYSSGPKQQLATIIFAGLAGAILGLSTLSFYGRPQDKLSNIAIGFAVGIIGGTVHTTYKTATQPYQLYDEASIIDEERMFEMESQFAFQEANPVLPIGGYSWTF